MKKPLKIYFKPDLLFIILLSLLVVLTVFGAVFTNIWLLLLALPFAAFSVYRVLSSNLAARAKENEITVAVVLFLPRLALRLWRRLFPDRRHGFAACPACSARLRFKKRSGDFYLTCPRCQTRFPVHIK